MVMGGRTGWVRDPNIFCKPRNDHSMRLCASFDSGSGQPWAMCQAHILERYLRAVAIDTGSKWVFATRDASNALGSVTTHRVKE